MGVYGELLSSVLATVWFRAQGTPFSAYGEVVILVASNLLVALALLRYRFPGAVHVAAAVAVFAVAVGLALQASESGLPALGLSAPRCVVLLQWAFNGIFEVARASQIAAIFACGRPAAEGLALLSLLLQFSGTVARVFTTSQEVKDPMQLAFSALNALLNGTVLVQYLVLVACARPEAPAARKRKDNAAAAEESSAEVAVPTTRRRRVAA